MTDFILKNERILGVVTQEVGGASEWLADAVIVATGHSARDICPLTGTTSASIVPWAYGWNTRNP